MSKSLGRLEHPSFDLVEFRGDEGKAQVLVKGLTGRSVRLVLYVWQVKKIADLARQIVARQEDYATSQQIFAKELADYVGEPKRPGT